ncbi:glutamine synthetase-like [Syngnathus acus]|uniref:glutamine synthetase-like n=1 Tax=Syngnathus acus TaxID=161584 RepID=UPI0018861F68|nr:glutamine synthetase-like [Syngnathus acus]XP_037120946.1 glutamine synthetase-like [Syngnathus acus]
MFKDPFNLDPNKLVLCELFNDTNLAAEANHRMSCKKVMDQVQKHQLLFAIKQEYTLTTIDGHLCGWPQNGFPASQDPKAAGRDIVVCHYKACRYAGINIFRTYEKDKPWQCEFQIGLCEGIEMGDQLWVARFLLHRVCEDFGVVAALNPKPIKGNWNGSGGHTNFSTKQMREEGESCLVVDHLMKNPGGRRSRYIEEAMKKLNVEHIKVSDPHSGQDNMSHHETPNMDKFSTEISNRGASIRIPHQVIQDKKGESCDQGHRKHLPA